MITQRRLATAAHEANNEAAVARYLADRDAATQDTSSAREAQARETVACAVAARATEARIGVFTPPVVSADSVAIARNTGVPMLPRAHTRHSATFMAPDRPHHVLGSNGFRASTPSTAPDRRNLTAVSNAVRAPTTSMAPDRSHRAAISSAAGHNGVQTSTATGRHALIPTACAAEATQHAQDGVLYSLPQVSVDSTGIDKFHGIPETFTNTIFGE